jgi:hypothetical protein
MYVLTVPKKADFIFEVHQEDVRCEGAKEYIDVGVSVLKANETYGTLRPPLALHSHLDPAGVCACGVQQEIFSSFFYPAYPLIVQAPSR